MVYKKILLACLISFISSFGISQNELTETDSVSNETTLKYADKMPEFPGGNLALRKYIAGNVTYPKSAKKNKIQGIVFVRFQIKKDGSVGIIEIAKGVDKSLDDEAISVIKTLPNFTPGIHKGNKVNVWYAIPISFKLN